MAHDRWWPFLVASDAPGLTTAALHEKKCARNAFQAQIRRRARFGTAADHR